MNTDKNNRAQGSALDKPKKNRRKTTEDFIRQARVVHGDYYDYSRVEYVNNKTKVTVGCPKHGYYEVIPKTHLKGGNCRKCAYEINGKNRTWTTDDFLAKARKVHGDKYDYSKTVVTKANHKCIITCPKHGDFNVKPTTHARGIGCRMCAGEYRGNLNRVGTEKFIERFKEVHGNRYDYSLVDYKKRSEDVTIICKEHGEFEQSPGSHMAGGNCPKCVTLFYESDYWDAHSHTNLYVLEIKFSGYELLKVGISKDISVRLSVLKKDLKKESDVEIKVLYTLYGESEPICLFEKSIHDSDELENLFVGKKFGGYTECYPVKYKQLILDKVKEFEKTLKE